ncbi:hypothetical protein GCM10011452_25680 [Gemmobacter lanyuensis]|uniref:Acetolactate synthase n=1 Tax=Gemmobacter lanyuensis TaxID=1054497 RepID=A0A918IXW4_9RHOB|nr:DUF6497 family protein [Gemmobacter lanyuensis]GGW36096.1 hypothetical protein GCM10011452_25680 [Gemmobacter lanyuensis]
MTGTPQTVKQPVDGEVVLTGDAAAIAVPSGQAVTLQDVIWNAAGPNGLTLRFRFLAPQIAREAGDVDFETASADMLALCQSFALPRLAELGPQPQQIIISLADRVVPFGETSPDATQYFEAYSIENGTCIWEMF